MSKPSGGPNMSQAAKRPDGYDDWCIFFILNINIWFKYYHWVNIFKWFIKYFLYL